MRSLLAFAVVAFVMGCQSAPEEPLALKQIRDGTVPKTGPESLAESVRDFRIIAARLLRVPTSSGGEGYLLYGVLENQSSLELGEVTFEIKLFGGPQNRELTKFEATAISFGDQCNNVVGPLLPHSRGGFSFEIPFPPKLIGAWSTHEITLSRAKALPVLSPSALAANDDVEGLKKFEKDEPGFATTTFGENQTTLGHIAASTNAIRVLEYLKQRGAKFDKPNGWAFTPMDSAAIAGAVDAMAFLVAEGISVHERDPFQKTPLFYAAEGNQLEAAKWLVEKGADLEAMANGKTTPLMYAMDHGSADVAKWLIDQKAKTDRVNHEGKNILHLAASANNGEAIELALSVGIPIESRVGNKKGEWTALNIAISGQNYEAVKALLKHGANPDSKDDRGRTPRQSTREDPLMEAMLKKP